MKKFLFIKFNTVDEVHNFIKKSSDKNYDIILSRGKYNIDAKSLLGVFNLGLNNKIRVILPNDELTSDFESTFHNLLV